MRQPFEDRIVTISRARFSVEYPASFMLMASMNPLSLWLLQSSRKDCVCSRGCTKYLNKISGPLLDTELISYVEVTLFLLVNKQGTKMQKPAKDIRERVIKIDNYKPNDIKQRMEFIVMHKCEPKI